MTVALKTLSPLTWQGTPSVISSQESVDGQEHLKLPSGTQIDLFGLDLHPVKVFPLPEKVREKTIADTCGRSSSILLESANLQQSLENKLQQLLDMGGLTIYKATLKQKVTPQQRVYFHLGLSARTTKGTGSSSPQSSWPTPSTRDHKGGYKGGRIRNGKLSTDTLDVAAQLTAWPTPTAATGGPSKNPNNKRGIHGGNPMATAASLVPWATPTATDPSRGTKPPRPQDTGIPLTQQVSGLNPESSTAETESTAPSRLNPRFSLWLMGYPIEWAYCAEQVTPSSHRQQQK